MTALTIQDVSRRSGRSEPTLRYYEEIGLIGPIARDASSGHRRCQAEDLDVRQALACMRALGVGIEDMRVYQANRSRGHEAATEQRDLLLRHEEAPGDDLPRPIIHNDRARDELDWRPRPVESTIVETAESLRDLGLLDDSARE